MNSIGFARKVDLVDLASDLFLKRYSSKYNKNAIQ